MSLHEGMQQVLLVLTGIFNGKWESIYGIYIYPQNLPWSLLFPWERRQLKVENITVQLFDQELVGCTFLQKCKGGYHA